jgi:hypothetical protein
LQPTITKTANNPTATTMHNVRNVFIPSPSLALSFSAFRHSHGGADALPPLSPRSASFVAFSAATRSESAKKARARLAIATAGSSSNVNMPQTLPDPAEDRRVPKLRDLEDWASP